MILLCFFNSDLSSALRITGAGKLSYSRPKLIPYDRSASSWLESKTHNLVGEVFLSPVTLIISKILGHN